MRGRVLMSARDARMLPRPGRWSVLRTNTLSPWSVWDHTGALVSVHPTHTDAVTTAHRLTTIHHLTHGDPA